MTKKLLIVICLFFSFGGFTTKGNSLFHSSQNSGIASDFQHLSSQQLFDTAEHYFKNRNFETASFLYNLLINRLINSTDVEYLRKKTEALIRYSVLSFYRSDYRTASYFLIRALNLSESHNLESFGSRIYGNLGNINYHFGNFDMAKSRFLTALELNPDSTIIVGLLNNLGSTERKRNNHESAFFYLHKAMQISKRHNNIALHSIFDNLALFYQDVGLYDSAFHYFRLSLNKITENNAIELKAEVLSNLGNLFFLTKSIDSALFYINLSNKVAKELGFLRVLSKNHLILSQIQRSKGNQTQSFQYFEKHIYLRESILNIELLGDINYLQRLYETSRTNRQIEQMAIDRKVKEQTIHYQRIIQGVMLIALLLMSITLGIVLFQKRKLNTAYGILFEKNLEIIELKDNKLELMYKKSSLKNDAQDDLLNKILILMNDTSIICDPNFSIQKLAELVHSNQKYISQVVNNVIGKNFRSFLNGYRIREAQRLFSEPDAMKYTIEFVALSVGFKSQSAFRDAFKEITGVSPNFYLKSVLAKK